MRVVSWNIHWGCGKDGRIRIHAIIDVLRKLNPDVICLQEVASNHAELEGNATSNQFRQLAGAFGGYQPVIEPTSEIYQNNMPRQFGNMLLSKFRINQVHRYLLPWPPDPESPAGMPRGLIEAVIDAPGGKVRVKARLPANLVVDCSHANSYKKPELQPLVMSDVVQQIRHGNKSLVGVMIESNIVGGNQKIPADLSQLKYGCSVTDGCIDWDATEKMLRAAHAELLQRP